MRLRRNRLKEFWHKKAMPKKDKEGSSYVEYGPPSLLAGETWTAGGKIQQEMYGKRLPNIRNIRLQGSYEELAGEQGGINYRINQTEITVGDGICLYAKPKEDPDYKVIAIYPYRFLTLDLERI